MKYLRIVVFFALTLAASLSWAKPIFINGIAAIVDDDVITTQELQDEIVNVKRQLRSQGTAMPPADILQKQVLEREIIKTIQLHLAANTGIRVDDTELNGALTRIAQQNNMDLRELKNALEGEGFDFAH